MPKFSNTSEERLRHLDSRLVEVLREAIELYDFSILCTYRDKEEQDKAFDEGKSKLRFPHSKHNWYPSKAVDIAPYPIDWQDEKRFTLLAGLIMGIAHEKGLRLRWGGDWDTDGNLQEEKFKDLPHLEIVDAE